jgi:hypothetical protein
LGDQMYHLTLRLFSTLSGWFSPGTPVSSTEKKTDRHDITEMLLKVAFVTASMFEIKF